MCPSPPSIPQSILNDVERIESKAFVDARLRAKRGAVQRGNGKKSDAVGQHTLMHNMNNGQSEPRDPDARMLVRNFRQQFQALDDPVLMLPERTSETRKMSGGRSHPSASTRSSRSETIAEALYAASLPGELNAAKISGLLAGARQPATERRNEIIGVRQRMHSSLQQLGVSSETHGYPREVRKLLKLALQEQQLWDLGLQQLVSIMSAQMAETGQLVSEIRARYSNLFWRIPKAVSDIYQQLQAREAISNRMAAELFKIRDELTCLAGALPKTQGAGTTNVHDVNDRITSRTTIDEELPDPESGEIETGLPAIEVAGNLADERISKELAEDRQMWIDAAVALSAQLAIEHGLPDVNALQRVEHARMRATNQALAQLSAFNRQRVISISQRISDWLTQLKTCVLEIEADDVMCRAELKAARLEFEGRLVILRVMDTNHRNNVAVATGTLELKPPAPETIQEVDDHAGGDEQRSKPAAERTREMSLQAQLENDDKVVVVAASTTKSDNKGCISELEAGAQALLRQRERLEAFDMADLLQSTKRCVDSLNTLCVRYTSERVAVLMGKLNSLQNRLEGWTELANAFLLENNKSKLSAIFQGLLARLVEYKGVFRAWMQNLKRFAGGESGIATQVIAFENELEERYKTLNSLKIMITGVTVGGGGSSTKTSESLQVIQAFLVEWLRRIAQLQSLMRESEGNCSKPELCAAMECWVQELDKQVHQHVSTIGEST